LSTAAVETRKDFLIDQLIILGFHEHPDGRQLYELSLAELESIYINQRIKQARKKPIYQTAGLFFILPVAEKQEKR
jgi:hypothetical protein